MMKKGIAKTRNVLQAGITATMAATAMDIVVSRCDKWLCFEVPN